MTHTRPTWAEISRSSLIGNYRTLGQRMGPQTILLSVVKADAYGHGLACCAQALAAAGCGWFGVTSVEEGLALRRICPEARILIMSGLWPEEANTAVEHRLTPVVWEPRHVHWMEQAARSQGLSSVPVHLEIDTGMSRQGVQLGHLGTVLDSLIGASLLKLEAVMTHFHSPDEAAANVEQIRQFQAAVNAVFHSGLRPEILSAGSSTDLLHQGTLSVTNLACELGASRMLRAGLSLYGYDPCGEAEWGLHPVLQWKTRVTGLREIESGDTAGYSGTFRAGRPTRLALLPVGYADGLNRLLSNRGSVLIRGQRARIAGRISMDQTMVDVTDISGVQREDEVVLIGEQGSASVSAADLAQITGTIPYEVLCAISARVPRTMVE